MQKTLSGEWKRPYRILICAYRYEPVRKLKRQTIIEKRGIAWFGWTETQHYNEARLPSAGSFSYPGIFAVRRAAIDALAMPAVHQVQIRTDQDKTVYLWNKHSDGRITGYRPDNDRF